MKTKIIYISGSEVFEMADVRAAFEEVRSTLGLARDTIIFGVPVDNDYALAPTIDSAKTATDTQNITVIKEKATKIIEETPSTMTPQEISEQKEEEPINKETVIETAVIETPIVDEVPTPVKKSRGRPRKAVTPATDEEVITPTQSEKVIPILSVLATNNAPVSADTVPAQQVTEDQVEEAPAAETEETIIAEVVEGDSDNQQNEEFEDLDDMVAAQAPEAPIEKTLEQLLESMTPLREDHGDTQIADTDEDDPSMTEDAEVMALGDTDATLEQLASEFADTEDQIAAPAPMPSQGKIGKLKNILPFKKARRDDTGLMGDLFGWAGVAANDEDFSIPGFFTTAASKK